MSVYVFTDPDVTASTQIQDIVECLKSVDPTLKVDKPEEVTSLQLIELVEKVLGKVPHFKSIDMVLHSVLVVITDSKNNRADLVEAVNSLIASLTVRCETMDAIQFSLRLKLLTNLLVKIPQDQSALFAKGFVSVFEWAAKHKLLGSFPSTGDQINDFISDWNLKPSEKISIWRSVIATYKAAGQKERVRDCLVELLRCVPEDIAPTVKQEATECIVAHIADPLVYSFDGLTHLKPVQMLEGERIHDLLMILMRGSVDEYNKFLKDNGAFLDGLGLGRDVTIAKLRVLSFLHLAEGKTELGYDVIAKQVGIDIAGVEPFLFDVVRTGLARLRLDQAGKRARVLSLTWSHYVGSGMEQWREIQRRLAQMRGQVDVLMENFSEKPNVNTSSEAMMASTTHCAALAISSRVASN
jgi:hypothetical protein